MRKLVIFGGWYENSLFGKLSNVKESSISPAFPVQTMFIVINNQYKIPLSYQTIGKKSVFCTF